jgi:EpsI family protein
MSKPFAVSLIMGLLMVSSSILSMVMAPSVDSADQLVQLDLEAMIPGEFGNWKIDLPAASLMINPEVNGTVSKIYTQTLSRTYINNQGERIMLSIAYGRDQRTDLQVHRPEVCYRTGGFDISNMTQTFVDTTLGRIPVMHLVAKQGIRNEPITYWIRMGDSLTRGWFEQKAATLRYAMIGKVPDGLLFRISTISNDEQDSYRIQQIFLTALLQAVRSEDRHWLVGRLTPS